MKHDKTTHWTGLKLSETLMMDALLKHLLGLMPHGMTDLGEVMEVVGQLKPDDEDQWIASWSELAQRIHSRAEASHAAGHTITAASLYLRAATYWRASLLYFSKPEDARMQDFARIGADCYEKYLSISGYPGRYVEIPYEGGYLPGHFYRAPNAADKAPLLILTPGRDTWAADTCWVYDAALKRGIHCLVYDGPGQGLALRLQGLHFRSDWENVLSPVVDYALTLPGIDPNRIGLMGLSFGAFLSTRAVAFEKRIKLCIADPGSLSWGDSIINHFPAAMRPALVGSESARRTFAWLAEHTPVEWLIRDYAWKHGVPAHEVFTTLQAYDNTPIVGQIECQMLIVDGTEEMARPQARQLYDALGCPKHYLLFDEATTAQAHCQIGAYATAIEYLFNWIDDHL